MVHETYFFRKRRPACAGRNVGPALIGQGLRPQNLVRGLLDRKEKR